MSGLLLDLQCQSFAESDFECLKLCLLMKIHCLLFVLNRTATHQHSTINKTYNLHKFKIIDKRNNYHKQTSNNNLKSIKITWYVFREFRCKNIPLFPSIAVSCRGTNQKLPIVSSMATMELTNQMLPNTEGDAVSRSRAEK